MHTQSIVCATVLGQCLEYLGYVTLAHSGKEGQFRVINATAHINYLVKNLVKKWREGETSLTKASFKKGLNLFKVSYHIAWRFD